MQTEKELNSNNMKYLSELAKLNVSEADMLKNKKLRDMAEAIKGCKETEAVIKEKIKNNDGDIDELKADLAEIQGDIANIDNDLCAAIPSWNQNRMKLLANLNKSGATRGRKPKNTPAPVAAPVIAPQQPVIATPAPAPAPAVAPVAVPDGDATVQQKKKSNGGAFILFGALALIVTVGAVNLFKKQ